MNRNGSNCLSGLNCRTNLNYGYNKFHNVIEIIREPFSQQHFGISSFFSLNFWFVKVSAAEDFFLMARLVHSKLYITRHYPFSAINSSLFVSTFHFESLQTDVSRIQDYSIACEYFTLERENSHRSISSRDFFLIYFGHSHGKKSKTHGIGSICTKLPKPFNSVREKVWGSEVLLLK